MAKKPNWPQLSGMSEDQAEQHMLSNWGRIPEQWNDPLFRDKVLGVTGQAELTAHMNSGEMAYGGEDRLGQDAKGAWHRRNIEGQGHPAEDAWLEKFRKK